MKTADFTSVKDLLDFYRKNTPVFVAEQIKEFELLPPAEQRELLFYTMAWHNQTLLALSKSVGDLEATANQPVMLKQTAH